MKDIKSTLKERQATHGDFTVNAAISQEIKELFSLHLPPSVGNVQREGLSAIAAKLARILSGGIDHADNWHDIAGYATLVEQSLTATKNPNELIDEALTNAFCPLANYCPEWHMNMANRLQEGGLTAWDVFKVAAESLECDISELSAEQVIQARVRMEYMGYKTMEEDRHKALADDARYRHFRL